MSKIMIVDDESDIRSTVGMILENEGYEVVEAIDGSDCLRKIRKEMPDLVLLDIMMPDMSGWQVLNAIQSDDELKSISITMFTVKPITPKTLKKDGVNGLIDYIVKPFSKKGFIDSIDDIFSTINKIEESKTELKTIDEGLAERYEQLIKTDRLHGNALKMLENILRERKMDGSLDDIQSFEDVIVSESRLIENYKKEIKEIEGKIKQAK